MGINHTWFWGSGVLNCIMQNILIIHKIMNHWVLSVQKQLIKTWSWIWKRLVFLWGAESDKTMYSSVPVANRLEHYCKSRYTAKSSWNKCKNNIHKTYICLLNCFSAGVKRYKRDNCITEIKYMQNLEFYFKNRFFIQSYNQRRSVFWR